MKLYYKTQGTANLSSASIYGSANIDYQWALNEIIVTRWCYY